jgi:hypothetical protein
MKIKMFDCCGGPAPAFKQWYNQDDEYGICSDCFKMHVEKYGQEIAENYFGKSGIHHSIV